ncbi:MAG: hypothetical protein PHG08_01075 [Bacilli bacterium]|nr:hypothetical protein [Bacilli bacterium]
MSITITTISNALAVAEPKTVILNGNSATVYTGADVIPVPINESIESYNIWPTKDTTIDRTEEIQHLIDTQRVVYFAPGVYSCGTLTLPAASYLSNLPTQSVRFMGDNSRFMYGALAGTTHINFTSTSAFIPSIPYIDSSFGCTSVRISGLSFQSQPNGNCIFFNTLALGASRITECNFYGFKNILLGAMQIVSSFDHNYVYAMHGPAFSVIPTNANITVKTTPIVDSTISYNYFNGAGYVSNPDYALLNIPGAAATSIDHNYFDFAWGGIIAGKGNGLVTISDNTFDILTHAVILDYGALSTTISNNRFLRCRAESRITYFTTPSAGMSGTNWGCILIGSLATDITIIGNTIKQCDTFIYMGGYWYKNIKEIGNVGTPENVNILVNMVLRQPLNESGYNAIGLTGDGTGFYMQSMEGAKRTTLPNPVTESYNGHKFYLNNKIITNIDGLFYDAMGIQVT